MSDSSSEDDITYILEDIDIKDAGKFFDAAVNGNLEIVKEMVENKTANVNQTDSDGYTALILASSSGHLPVVKYLLEQGADPTQVTIESRTNALFFATKSGSLDIMSLLIQQDHNTPLIWGCLENQIDACQYLLSEGANSRIINATDKTVPMCLCLISTTQNYDEDKDKRKAEFLRLILESYKGEFDVVNFTDCTGNTALHYASLSSSYHSIQVLFDFGADLTIKNDAGLTALDCIARKIAHAKDNSIATCDIYLFQTLTKKWTDLENFSRNTMTELLESEGLSPIDDNRSSNRSRKNKNKKNKSKKNKKKNSKIPTTTINEIICDHCSYSRSEPKVLTSIRYKCDQCPDYDLCSDCYQSHDLIHPMHTFTLLTVDNDNCDDSSNSNSKDKSNVKNNIPIIKNSKMSVETEEKILSEIVNEEKDELLGIAEDEKENEEDDENDIYEEIKKFRKGNKVKTNKDNSEKRSGKVKEKDKDVKDKEKDKKKGEEKEPEKESEKEKEEIKNNNKEDEKKEEKKEERIDNNDNIQHKSQPKPESQPIEENKKSEENIMKEENSQLDNLQKQQHVIHSSNYHKVPVLSYKEVVQQSNCEENNTIQPQDSEILKSQKQSQSHLLETLLQPPPLSQPQLIPQKIPIEQQVPPLPPPQPPFNSNYKPIPLQSLFPQSQPNNNSVNNVNNNDNNHSEISMSNDNKITPKTPQQQQQNDSLLDSSPPIVQPLQFPSTNGGYSYPNSPYNMYEYITQPPQITQQQQPLQPPPPPQSSIFIQQQQQQQNNFPDSRDYYLQSSLNFTTPPPGYRSYRLFETPGKYDNILSNRQPVLPTLEQVMNESLQQYPFLVNAGINPLHMCGLDLESLDYQQLDYLQEFSFSILKKISDMKALKAMESRYYS